MVILWPGEYSDTDGGDNSNEEKSKIRNIYCSSYRRTEGLSDIDSGRIEAENKQSFIGYMPIKIKKYNYA